MGKITLYPPFVSTKKSSFKLQKRQKYFLPGVHFAANPTQV
jgi:hypothetical protein